MIFNSPLNLSLVCEGRFRKNQIPRFRISVNGVEGINEKEAVLTDSHSVSGMEGGFNYILLLYSDTFSNAKRVNKIEIQPRIKHHKVESEAIFINFPRDKKVERRMARTQTKQKS